MQNPGIVDSRLELREELMMCQRVTAIDTHESFTGGASQISGSHSKILVGESEPHQSRIVGFSMRKSNPERAIPIAQMMAT
jgi:hypothetical protein